MLEQIASISGLLAALVSLVSAVLSYMLSQSKSDKREELDANLKDIEKHLREVQAKAAALNVSIEDKRRLSQALDAVSATRADLDETSKPKDQV
jgi:septal ring factor EnvC (AmiA/AmiB activator)